MSGDGKGSRVRRPRAVSRPWVPPGPLADLKALLYELYVAAGPPTLDEVAAWVAADEHEDLAGAPGRDTVSRIIGDPGVPPSQADVVAVATVLARAARWDPGDAAGRARELWVAARMAPRVPAAGVRVSEADPRRLGVHAAISVPGVPDEIPPEYVPRPHDEQLRVVVDDAASGESRLVVLVGGSAVGKTRACWEAARRLDEGWRLWHPLSPGRVEALLDGLSQVGPQTVIWLNETQHYLMPAPLGETAAARLRELLADRSRGPVLVMGTIWPEHWGTLTSEPADRRAGDPHAQARELLSGSSVVVPETFDEDALAEVRTLSARDARLAEAFQDADHGQVTQYLAGVPALVERYRTATPAEKALVHAAMDLKRLSDSELFLDFLADAAPGYLTDAQWGETDEDRWLEDALQAMAAPCKGVLGPLTRVRIRTRKRQEGRIRYRLADYLERLGRDEREKKLPPSSFWAAAGDHLPAAALPGLASQARSRGMYRIAAGLLKDSLRNGVEAGAAGLLSLLAEIDPASLDEAAQWLLSTLPAVHLTTAWRLVDTLLDHGLVETARHVRQQAASTAPLHDPGAVADFLDRPSFLTRSGLLSEWDDEAIITALLARDPAAHVALTDINDIEKLLRRFAAAGARAQVARLATRLAAETDDVRIVAFLGEIGANEQATDAVARLTRLAGHAMSAVDVADPDIAFFLRDLHSIGATELIDDLLRRDPVGRADLDSSRICFVLSALAEVGAHEQAARLMERIRTHALTAPPDWTASLYEMALELRFDEELVAQLPVPDFTALFGLDVLWTPIVRVLAMRSSPAALDELVDRLTAAAPEGNQNPRLLTVLDALAEVDLERLARPLVALAAAPLTNPEVVAWLLDRLADRGSDDITDLLARDPAGTVNLTDPEGLVALFTVLDRLGRHDQVTAVLGRDPFSHVSVTSPTAVAAMWEATTDLVPPARLAVLAARASRDTDVADLGGAVRLLRCMLTIDTGEPATALAVRAADHADRWTVTGLLHFLGVAAHPALASVQHHLVARAVGALATADLFLGGHYRQAPALLAALHEAGASKSAVALAHRVVGEVDLDRAGTCARWAQAMRDLGAPDAADALALRAANAGHFDLYLKINPEQTRTYAFGREPGGRPASRWGWRDLE